LQTRACELMGDEEQRESSLRPSGLMKALGWMSLGFAFEPLASMSLAPTVASCDACTNRRPAWNCSLTWLDRGALVT
jgi:hypothetical protein